MDEMKKFSDCGSGRGDSEGCGGGRYGVCYGYGYNDGWGYTDGRGFACGCSCGDGESDGSGCGYSDETGV